MPTRIFYSWQSDRPNETNKDFIKIALDEAKNKINQDLQLLGDSERSVFIDHDSLNVPGMPALTETIKAKIRDSAAVVLDLTFIGRVTDATEGQNVAKLGRHVSNPNVLLEYSYAEAHLTDSALVSVLNTSFGEPKNNMPFDMAHKRWPILYDAPDGEKYEDARQAATNHLVNELVSNLKPIIQAYLDRPRNLQNKTHEQQAVEGGSCFVESGHKLATVKTPADRNRKIVLTPRSGSRLFVRFIPFKAQVPLQSHETQKFLMKAQLNPISTEPFQGCSEERNSFGAIAYAKYPESKSLTDKTIDHLEVHFVESFVQLFRSREVWAVDSYVLAPDYGLEEDDQPGPSTIWIEDVKRCLKRFIERYLKAAASILGLNVPIRMIIGVTGVENFSIAYGTNGRSGDILVDAINVEVLIKEFGSNPDELIEPFLKKLFSEGGWVY